MRRRLFAAVPRPTRSAAWLLMIAAILELLGHLIQSSGVTIAASMALGAIFGDLVLTPAIDKLTVTRAVTTRMTVGVPVRVQLMVSTQARRRIAHRPIVVIDQPPGLPTSRVVVPRMSTGGSVTATYDATPLARGYWADERMIVIEAFSPLGGFVRRRRLSHGRPTWVHPRPAPPLRLPEPMAGQALGPTATARSGAGTDVFGVREWRTGDPSSSIHWRASAKRSHLVVLEREQPSNAPLVIVASEARVPDELTADVEAVIARVAVAAVAAQRARRRVTLVGSDASIDGGSTNEILDWFAAATLDTTITTDVLDHSLRSTGSGATVVWLGTDEPTSDVRRAATARGVGALIAPLARSRP